MTTAQPIHDDAHLLEASRAGEIQAFGELVERYQNLVCAVAYSRTGDHEISEDVGQQTFLAAWNGLDSIREPSQIRSWLCSVARNLSGKAVRVKQRERATEADALEAHPSPGSDPLATLISRESQAAVWEALEALPETYREPLVLFYRENRSVKEVALGLGISQDAAKQRLSRGRQALKAGVADLVERTLHDSRPNRAFVAGVLGAVQAAGLPGAAATAGSATGGLGTKLAVAGAAIAAVAAVAFATADDRESPPPAVRAEEPATADPDQALLAQLRQRREELQDEPAASQGCVLDGTVTDLEGRAVADASVSFSKNSLQADALTQDSTRTDAQGDWNSEPLAGREFLLSVTAPGYLAANTVARCDQDDGVDIVLAPGGTRLRGTVEDLGGGPVEGASVWLLPAVGDPSAAVSTTTDEDGRYDISVLPDRYTVLASHRDYVLSARQTVLRADTASEDFALLPGASVEGRVVDGVTGRAVEEATVTTLLSPRAALRSNAPMAAVFASFLPAISDAEGRYRIDGLPPGFVRVTARGADRVNTDAPEVSLALAQTRSDVDIELSEAHTVSGFVIGRESEDGVADLEVMLLPKGGPLTPSTATTDASGYYEVAGVQPGDYALLIAGRGIAPQLANESITVTEGDVHDVLSRADAGVSVRGRVESTDRVSIHLEPSEPGASPLAVAVLGLTRPELDASGAFHFPAVAPGDYVVVATTLEGEGRTPLTVGTSAVTGLSLELDPLGRLEGALTGPRGAPISGALVVAQPKDVPAIPSVAAMMAGQDRTDSEGRFEIVGLAGGDYDVTVFDLAGQRPWSGDEPDALFEPRRVEVPPAGTTRVDLEVQREPEQIQGVVVDSEGEPVEDAWVRIQADGAHRAPLGHDRRPTLTNDLGEFVLDDLYGSSFEVRANGPRGKLETNTTMVPGQEPARLVLASVSTVVASVTHDGVAVDEFDLDVSGGPTRVLGALVETRGGTFTLPRLQAGEYEIEVATETAYAKAVVPVGPDPETTVELALQSRGAVHGRALDADGTPLAGGTVMNMNLELSLRIPTEREVKIAEDGTFAFENLRPGRGSLMVLGPGETPDPVGSCVFDLKAGAELDLGTIQRGQRPTLDTAPFLDASPDLGVRFFVGPRPPSAEQLRAIDDADDPRELLELEGARLWIADVTADSHAAQAGLEPGDAVLSVGRMQVGDDERAPGDAMLSLSQRWRSAGRSVTWVVQRGDRELDVAVLVPRRQD